MSCVYVRSVVQCPPAFTTNCSSADPVAPGVLYWYVAGLLPLPVTDPPPEITDQVNGVPANEPPAVAPVSVIAALPSHEFTVPPIEPVGGVVQLTVRAVGIADPTQGAVPDTFNVAVKLPFGLDPFGVKVHAAGSKPPLVHVPSPEPPDHTGFPEAPPPVAPIIGIGVPVPEQTFRLGPALPRGPADHCTFLSEVCVPQGELPVTVSRNIPLPPPAESPLRKHPFKDVELFSVADPAVGMYVQVAEPYPPPSIVASDVVILLKSHCVTGAPA
jgi:hypothetical protein